MDNTILQNMFAKEGRINRSMFMAYLSVYSIIFYSSIVLSFLSYELAFHIVIEIFSTLIGVLIIALSIPLFIRRSHDFDKSGRFVLMLFVPVANFMFFVVPGTLGKNQYGDMPPESSNLIKTLAILYFVWPILFTWIVHVK